MPKVKHIWVEGKWIVKDRSWDKVCKCALCGLQKRLGRNNKKAIPFIYMYERSKQFYPHDHEPMCWGSKKIE